MLTLLVVPAFYDSIEIASERMLAKFRRRVGSGNAVVAFATTFGEAMLALLMLRGLYRAVTQRAR
jgi:HAE1 family hydrophobic/amphiphilic exporter-1